MNHHILKQLLRGIVFVFYFPFHLLSACISWCYEHLIERPLHWLWDRWINPFCEWVYRYLIIAPLTWLYHNVLKPIGAFLWNVIKQGLWPLIRFLLVVPVVFILNVIVKALYLFWHYVIDLPIRWLWNHLLKPIWKWFWEEIFLVVWRWAVAVTNWIFRVFVLVIWKPIKWLWGVVSQLFRWIRSELIRPMVQLIRSVFHPVDHDRRKH